MKISLRAGNLTVHAEGRDCGEVFEQLSAAQKTFEEDKCGLCESAHIQYVVREEGGYKFYELRCKDCYGKLTYGKSQDGRELYPRRYVTHKDGPDKGKVIRKDGKAIRLGKKGNGWLKYNKETGKDE